MSRTAAGPPAAPVTLGALARMGHVSKQRVQWLAARGLLPGYEPQPARWPARPVPLAIPADLAEHLGVALSSGVVTATHARMMRDDPERLVEGLRAFAAAVLTVIPDPASAEEVGLAEAPAA